MDAERKSERQVEGIEMTKRKYIQSNFGISK